MNFNRNKSSIAWLLLLGILGSIIVGLGEYFLHFIPEGPSGEISMLETVPLDRASKGHFLAILGAPLYFIGYYGLKKMFYGSSPVLAIILNGLGVLAFFIGGIWISSRYFCAEVLQYSMGTEAFNFYLESYQEHYQILVWGLRIIIALLSMTYILLVLKNNIGLPKWLAICNPIVLLVLVISSLKWFHALAIHIVPIAMNVTHFIFFGIILFYYLKKVSPHEMD